jgi:hypothetical protein
MIMGSVEEISKAIGRAKHMIVNSEIGEDAHGEMWIKVEEGWRRLDRLIRGALRPEVQAAWEWLDLALSAIHQAGEIADGMQEVDVPGVPGNMIDTWCLKS